MRSLFILATILLSFAFASAQTGEQALIVEKEFNYKDWSYKSIKDDKKLNLRDLAKDKKLVLVVYFSGWCGNWKNEAPIVQRLYDKYKNDGLEIIGVGEYDTVASLQNSLNFFKITFPVVYETTDASNREKTDHFKQRKSAGDNRTWGSPWNVFLTPENMMEKGDTIAKKAFVANGELMEADADKFIREKLGLAVAETKKVSAKKDIEQCPGDTTNREVANFKMPN